MGESVQLRQQWEWIAFLFSTWQCAHAQEGFPSSLPGTVLVVSVGAATLLRYYEWKWHVHAVSSQLALMASPAGTKAADSSFMLYFDPVCDFFKFLLFIRGQILDVCLFLFHSHLFLTSLTESHTLIPTSASPSQVEMMYDLYCQLLPRVKRKLVMTRASLLCRGYTSSLSLLSWMHHECVGRNISLPRCVGAPWRGSLGLSFQLSTSIQKLFLTCK